MNAKTYGPLLRAVMDIEDEFERLSLVSDETMERCARAVILEFVRRVEDEALKISYSDIQGEADADCWHLSAFRKLAAELKEAK